VLAMAAEPETVYYTEARIRYWLRNWLLLESLAETPSTSTHHFGHGEDDERPCERAHGLSRNKGEHADPMRYADILADLRAAADQLPPYSLESAVVGQLIGHGPLSMRELRARMGRDMNAVVGAYRQAVAMMARSLGGGRE
jgi:hypothetical protein